MGQGMMGMMLGNPDNINAKNANGNNNMNHQQHTHHDGKMNHNQQENQKHQHNNHGEHNNENQTNDNNAVSGEQESTGTEQDILVDPPFTAKEIDHDLKPFAIFLAVVLTVSTLLAYLGHKFKHGICRRKKVQGDGLFKPTASTDHDFEMTVDDDSSRENEDEYIFEVVENGAEPRVSPVFG